MIKNYLKFFMQNNYTYIYIYIIKDNCIIKMYLSKLIFKFFNPKNQEIRFIN